MSITSLGPARRLVGLAATTAVVGAGLAVAFAAPSSSDDTIPCAADYATLIVQNGQKQYFECADTDGEGTPLRQGLASKNPWVLNDSPAMFADPTAQPEGAVGQVFTGQTQGVGVISSSDETGSERDSISRDEVLTIARDKLQQPFGSLRLRVNVLEPNTKIDVGAAGAFMPTDRQTSAGPLGVGEHTVEFFFDEQVAADRFAISAGEGSFQILSGAEFYFFSLAKDCTLPSGESCFLFYGTTTLTVTNTGDTELPVSVVLDLTEATCGTVTPNDENMFYRFEVTCERFIDYDTELEGKFSLNDTTPLDDLPDCADDPIEEVPNTKELCIKSLNWESDESGDGLREFVADNWADSDPRYA
jgi:hypothetical protein